MNNEDRELLELAAKAAGLIYIAAYGLCVNDEHPHGYDWSPLTDDGDALRLAVKLNLSIDVAGPTTSVFRHDIVGSTITAVNDPYAATRRAIVRAAAQIGK